MMPNDSNLALLHLGEALKQQNYHHITVTPATHARVNARQGNEWASDVVGVFGWSRPFRTESIPLQIYELMQQANILEPYQEGWRSKLRVSTLNGQLYFHAAWPTDAEDAVFFGPDTYRYIAAISQYLHLNCAPIHRAVDIGCGAGPGAVELALRLPQTEVIAVDINHTALQLTQVNAVLAGVQIQTKHSDLLAGVTGGLDLIIANPPYMMDHLKRAYRHGRGPLGMGLSLDIIETALQRLHPGGTLLLYTGSAIVKGEDSFLLAAKQRLEGRCSWQYREIDPDVFGEELESEAYYDVDRIAAVLLSLKTPS